MLLQQNFWDAQRAEGNFQRAVAGLELIATGIAVHAGAVTGRLEQHVQSECVDCQNRKQQLHTGCLGQEQLNLLQQQYPIPGAWGNILNIFLVIFLNVVW
jgi:predicted hotdog family 3-hydroxylacyl-ACP dehydratase